MSAHRLPYTINPMRFCEQRQYLEGQYLLADMPRLLETCIKKDSQLPVKVTLESGKDLQGLFYIKGKATAMISVLCQRCLQEMVQVLICEFVLSPVATEEKELELPSEYSALYTKDSECNLLHAIEDELLLELPIIPKHQNENCNDILGKMYYNSTQKDNAFVKLKDRLNFKK